MSVRELVVLGTASQVPTRYRNHNAYLLRWDGEGFLFDPGEGTQRQLIHAGISSPDITKICITHFHGDHCLGLAGISQLLSLDGCPHPVCHSPFATGIGSWPQCGCGTSPLATALPCCSDHSPSIQPSRAPASAPR